MKIHVVQKGDTLWKLAEHYGVDFEELKKANTQLTNPDMIMPGMKIKIPTSAVPAKQGIKGMPGPKEAPITPAPQAVAPIGEAPKELPKVMPKEMPKEMPKVELPMPAPAPAPVPAPTAITPDVLKMIKDAVASQLPALLQALKPDIINQIKIDLDYTKNVTQVKAPTKKSMPSAVKPAMPPAMPKPTLPITKETPKKAEAMAAPCPPGPFGSITMSGYGTGHMHGADQYAQGMITPGSFGSINMGGYPSDFAMAGAMPTAQPQGYAMPQAYGMQPQTQGWPQAHGMQPQTQGWPQALPYQPTAGDYSQYAQGYGMHAQPIQHQAGAQGYAPPRPDLDCGCD